jgi:hypothetical protein
VGFGAHHDQVFIWRHFLQRPSGLYEPPGYFAQAVHHAYIMPPVESDTRKCSKPHPVPTVQLLKDMARGVPHPPLSVRAATEATGPQNLKLFAAFPS